MYHRTASGVIICRWTLRRKSSVMDDQEPMDLDGYYSFQSVSIHTYTIYIHTYCVTLHSFALGKWDFGNSSLLWQKKNSPNTKSWWITTAIRKSCLSGLIYWRHQRKCSKFPFAIICLASVLLEHYSQGRSKSLVFIDNWHVNAIGLTETNLCLDLS